MPTNYVQVWNEIAPPSPTFSLTFEQLGTPLSNEYWGIMTNQVPPMPEGEYEPTQVMWVDNSEGIAAGQPYWWDIPVNLPDGTYMFTAQLQEIGDTIGSDKSISSKQEPSGWNDDWDDQENQMTTHVYSLNGSTYELQYSWNSLGWAVGWSFDFFISTYDGEEASQMRRAERLQMVQARQARK